MLKRGRFGPDPVLYTYNDRHQEYYVSRNFGALQEKFSHENVIIYTFTLSQVDDYIVLEQAIADTRQ